jgi:Domain of unknown function (DUF4159)/Aerotolerance regulator N-terminal
MTGLLGALAILQPWWLAALAALPILYWLLRVTPPAPRYARFPAIRLLLALQPKEETPAQTPLWLLLLRLLIAALIILALAHPLANPGAKLSGAGPLVLVVDDGWAAARNWPARQAAMADILDRAEREERPVMVLATAPTVTGEPPRASRLMRAAEARTIAGAIVPKPWPVDRAASLASLEGVSFPQQAAVVYLSDSVEDGQSFALLERLQRIGAVELFGDPPQSMSRLLLPPGNEAGHLAATATRLATGEAETATLRASGEDGRLIAREELRWAAGERSATARIAVPTELRNRMARLDIENENSAGTVVLLDERWRRRPVGLVSGASLEKLQPLLGDTYYLERALTPFSEVRTGDLQEILKREIAVMILADVGRLPEADRTALEQWVKRGGVVVRFAGSRMAEGSDDLIPVPLRSGGGGRAFGGAMTWAQPVALSAFDPNSPFAGLRIPDDVRVTRQVLAEPSLDLSSRTWARLSDGTPLVTADKREEGWLVLIHTTANPEWSSLPLSGLFVEMLQRLVGLSQGIAGAGADIALPPVSSLDGFGRLQSPPPAAVAIPPGGFAGVALGPKHPPGYYGTETSRRALNLSAAIPAPRLIQDLPSGVARAVYTGAREFDFRPWLLSLALALALIDLFISLALRGVWAGRARRAAAILLAAGALLAEPANAQLARPAPNAADDAGAVLATMTTRFAYVATGIAEIDETSRAGMAGLGTVLTRRTAVDPGPPVDVDPEQDELSFYPLIYWPISPQGPRLSPNAIQRVNAFLKNGGTILFDTREADGGQSGPAALRLREILRQLNLAALAPIPDGHVLTKAFYLLSDFPGRWAGAPVWVELGDDRVNDGVSSVIIGAHDWAAAWAVDQGGRPIYAAMPGGEAQRETAVRFGVNLVMYALTGNYKADQVHVEAILERLKR